MSMHEFEDVVEGSIRLLTTSHRSIEDLRCCYATLYHFQEEWDTGYTHFRVMDLLLSARYVYRIPVSEYPMQGRNAPVEDGWNVREVRAIGELRALAIPMEYGCLRTPTSADRAEMPILDWWFQL